MLISTENTKPAESLQQSSAGSDLVKKHPSAMLNLDPTQDNTKIHDQTRVQSKWRLMEPKFTQHIKQY